MENMSGGCCHQHASTRLLDAKALGKSKFQWARTSWRVTQNKLCLTPDGGSYLPSEPLRRTNNKMFAARKHYSMADIPAGWSFCLTWTYNRHISIGLYVERLQYLNVFLECLFHRSVIFLNVQCYQPDEIGVISCYDSHNYAIIWKMFNW